MNAGKLLTSAAVAFVAMFVLSYLWHEIIMADYYASNTPQLTRDEFIVPLIAAGYVVLAIVMAYMYPLGYKGGSAMVEGFRFGAVVGVLVWLSTNLVYTAIWNYPMGTALVDSAWHVVEEGIGGMAIALVFARGTNEHTPDVKP